VFKPYNEQQINKYSSEKTAATKAAVLAEAQQTNKQMMQFNELLHFTSYCVNF